jgi:ABC-type phosphate transport system substrate-binding protein
VLPCERGANAQAHDPLVVIVSLQTSMTDISLATLRRVFQGEATNATDGKRLIPMNSPLKSAERELFDRKVLGLEPAAVGRFWIDRRIRDEGLPPRTLPSVDLGVRVVASYPGAIAYVRASVAGKSVRILKVDGKSYSDPGYLFASH